MTRELPVEFTPEGGWSAPRQGHAFASAKVGVALLDRELQYLWAVNMCDAAGREPTPGATDAELFGPEAGATATALKRRALETGEAAHGALRLTIAGVERRYELSATPRRDADGAILGLVCVLVEAATPAPSAALQAHEAPTRPGPPKQAALSADLQRSRDLLRAIFDGIEDGLLLIDWDGTVLAVNAPFAALYGVEATTLAGRSWFEHCGGPGSPIPRELIIASLADGEQRVERVRNLQGDGALHLLDVQTLPLRRGDRANTQMIVHVRDVTARVKLEAQMVAAERFSANRHLAAVVAHEVNTPLQAIESCLHMAGRLAEAEQRGRYLRIAREEIQRVGQILRQLLDLYRPANEATTPVALNDLVERTLLLVGSSLARQGVIVERDLAPDLPDLLGKADELTQVLLNLIFNALQAMGRGGVLTVRTHCEERSGTKLLTLMISDTGPGIAPTTIERIFEPFFTTKPEGNGLGLAVSQSIVTAHGGTINAQSFPGEGATFCVTLPLAHGNIVPLGGELELEGRPKGDPR